MLIYSQIEKKSVILLIIDYFMMAEPSYDP